MHLYLFTYTLGRQLAALTRHLETGKNDIFKKSIPQERVIVDWHGVRIQNKKKIVQILNILILSGDIEPGKSSCLPSEKMSKKICLVCLSIRGFEEQMNKKASRGWLRHQE